MTTFLIILAGMLQSTGFDNPDPACGASPEAQMLASLIMSYESQQRPALECNAMLSEVAARRAQELAVESGAGELTPNQLLTRSGF